MRDTIKRKEMTLIAIEEAGQIAMFYQENRLSECGRDF
jgi:hypothetical protein